jgi:hypothetical protein
MQTSKDLQWQEISERVSRIVDALGRPVDPGICEMVVALHAHGVHTLASCEGHLDHGVAAPWIDIGDPQARPIAKEAHRLRMQGEQARAEQMRIETRQLHFQEYQRLVPLLEALYREIGSLSFASQLILTQEWSGMLR